jgi:hypothetical protein
MFNRSLWLLQERWDLFLSNFFDTRRNRSEQWRADCPKPRRIVFPNRSRKAGSLTNIWKRFWIPLQIDQGTQFWSPATGSIPFGTRQQASFQYLKWSSKRLQTVMGTLPFVTFDVGYRKHRVDMATIKAASRAGVDVHSTRRDMRKNSRVLSTQARVL